jgi:hypothetical protein
MVQPGSVSTATLAPMGAPPAPAQPLADAESRKEKKVHRYENVQLPLKFQGGVHNVLPFTVLTFSQIPRPIP